MTIGLRALVSLEFTCGFFLFFLFLYLFIISIFFNNDKILPIAKVLYFFEYIL